MIAIIIYIAIYKNKKTRVQELVVMSGYSYAQRLEHVMVSLATTSMVVY